MCNRLWYIIIWITIILMVTGFQKGYAAPTLDTLIEDFMAAQHVRDVDAHARAKNVIPDHWDIVDIDQLRIFQAKDKALMERLSALPVADWNAQDYVNADVMRAILVNRIARAPFNEEVIPFTGDWGFHIRPIFAIGRISIKSEADALATIKRISDISRYFDENISNMRRGLALGITAHKDPLATMRRQIEEQLIDDPLQSPLYTPFKALPDTISNMRQGDIKTMAEEAVRQAFEAYRNLAKFIDEDYAPAARTKAGIGSLPNGKAHYIAVIRGHTTLPDITPDQIHQTGLAEVARIRTQMEAIIAELGFEGSFAEFLTFLRTDPQFYAQSPEDLLRHASRISKRLDAVLPRYFNKLPRLPYGVEAVPEKIAPGYTTGRYISGDADAGRAGIYWVNTHRLDQRPLYELPALSAHEAVPGHHLQIALAQELEDVPEFRNNYYATAFGEGWALYTESLAGEAGIYQTPYEQFGKLSYEMWRACRLVVDTGIHWMGWSKEEARKCFSENSALAPHNIETELVRYIGWPGQATAYKIGELKIKALREAAEEALGDDFDIREFHDQVLEMGAIPLPSLERRITTWIEEQAR